MSGEGLEVRAWLRIRWRFVRTVVDEGTPTGGAASMAAWISSKRRTRCGSMCGAPVDVVPLVDAVDSGTCTPFGIAMSGLGQAIFVDPVRALTVI